MMMSEAEKILERFNVDDKMLIEAYFISMAETKLHIVRKKFTNEEDQKLSDIVTNAGTKIDWKKIAAQMEGRSARQCKERWTKYLSPSIKTTPWTPQEDELLMNKFNELGPKWVTITQYLPGRSDTSIKNRWLLLTKQKATTTKMF